MASQDTDYPGRQDLTDEQWLAISGSDEDIYPHLGLIHVTRFESRWSPVQACYDIRVNLESQHENPNVSPDEVPGPFARSGVQTLRDQCLSLGTGSWAFSWSDMDESSDRVCGIVMYNAIQFSISQPRGKEDTGPTRLR
jgi:hypothetical protein